MYLVNSFRGSRFYVGLGSGLGGLDLLDGCPWRDTAVML